ncbi:ceramidase domain-containing protein [Amorphus coralli]|uniref:ceramidase domain-containing protein n=1 Tax=Amorphus coralli TaxID=340680 RepID=UPI00035F656E|nr:ceramidase domain-containing protein [Amorphus coralli]
MNEALDLYCERLGSGFWAEPLNAVTNLAFLVAAALAIRAWAGRKDDLPVLLLALLTGVIGIGSFLFHTFATGWSAIADVAPIALFIYGFFFLAMRRFFGLGIGWAFAATGLYLAASVGAVPLLEPVFGGSAGYIPALLGLVGTGAILAGRRDPRAVGLLCAAMVFCASLAFRIVDEPFCAVLPFGTHFMWHVLNAAVLYIAMMTALDRPRRRKTV